MKRSIFALYLGLALASLAPAGAMADRSDDWYRDVRPYLDRNSDEAARRARLWERLVQLHTQVRQADRHGDLSMKDADGMYKRLDKVADHLRYDRHFSNHEYDHRRDDLDHVERDLHRDLGDRSLRR